jgi:hypothetical protein
MTTVGVERGEWTTMGVGGCQEEVGRLQLACIQYGLADGVGRFAAHADQITRKQYQSSPVLFEGDCPGRQRVVSPLREVLARSIARHHHRRGGRDVDFRHACPQRARLFRCYRAADGQQAYGQRQERSEWVRS